ncbi:MAG: hypothetical protein ACYSRZ_09380, partial [Planctomycetota bacterium]
MRDEAIKQKIKSIKYHLRLNKELSLYSYVFFKDLLDQVLSLLRQQPSDWIPVSERLPENDSPHLFLLESGNVVQGIPSCELGKHNPPLTHKATHWKPIVLPSEEKPCHDCWYKDSGCYPDTCIKPDDAGELVKELNEAI